MRDIATSYDWAEAYREAEAYVASFPIETANNEARLFTHAILNYFRALGVSEEERQAILFSCSSARMSEWHEGWEASKSVYQVGGNNAR